MQGVAKILIDWQALPAALPGTAQWTSPFVSPSVSYVCISSIIFATNAAQPYTLHIVPSGGTATNANKMFAAVAPGANKTDKYSFIEGELVLYAGASIWAFAGAANAVNLYVGGWLYP